MTTLLEPNVDQAQPALDESIAAACGRVPPLWSLKNFVAVNPFLGLTQRPFEEAARLVARIGHGRMIMPADYYREQIDQGHIQAGDVQAAHRLTPGRRPRLAGGADLASLRFALGQPTTDVDDERVLTFADCLDREKQTSWAHFVVEEISKWCSAYYDEGQSSWRMPWRDLGLFAAWREAAQLDANPEWNGLKGFRPLVASLGTDYGQVTALALDELEVPPSQWTDFLHRQLMSMPGWSGYVQYLVREQGMAGQRDDALAQLLAIRLVYDLALHRQFGHEASMPTAWPAHRAKLEDTTPTPPGRLTAGLLAQQALECAFQRELVDRLQTHTPPPAPNQQPSLQAVFCIDVRSEIFRRALEAQADDIETLGFAGFFGMPIEYQPLGQPRGGAQCPALLTPKYKVRETLRPANADREQRWHRDREFHQTVSGAWNAFKTSAISCFSFVETAGLWFAAKLVKDSFTPTAPETASSPHLHHHDSGPCLEKETCGAGPHEPHAETGIGLDDRIELAAGALKNMGLVSNFARVVLLCGHGSATANNPYSSALDCGACGGHAGDANARVAAAILNDPRVRRALRSREIEIPATTRFVAGLHNTTTDEVHVYEDEAPDAARAADLAQIKRWLAAASSQARRERAATLGLGGAADDEVDDQILARSRDWSEVRPEWGLAGNAAFIAAPRARTKGLNLGGRVFLHNYDAGRDHDRSVLELIMTAPMVVASWINLQYYGSTVDNRLFGSGNKVLHNVVGTFGVWQGNGGDLQTGLPLQSVHDGTRWRHEPLRLSVFIEATRASIAAVLEKQPGVRELVENGWLHLFVIEPGGRTITRWPREGITDRTS